MSQLQVTVEVRPRLSVANCVLTCLDPLPDPLNLSCQAETVSINELVYTVPQVNFKPNKISGLVLTQNSATFRLETCNTDLDNKFEVLEPLPLVPHPTLCQSKPLLSPNTLYSLLCSVCHTVCGAVGPGRVLPRPSSGWKEGSSDWFCCAHKTKTSGRPEGGECGKTAKTSFVAGHSDVLWGPASFLVHGDSVEGKCREEGGNLLNCVHCGAEFGSIGCTGEENAKIWNYGVTFREVASGQGDCEGNDLSGDIENLNLSQNVGKFILEKTKTAGDTFERLVSSIVGESSAMMPKIMFSSKVGDLFCWVMDKNLCIYKNSLQTPYNPMYLKKQNMLKILYKEASQIDDLKSIKNDLSVFTEVISEEMFVTGLEALKASVQDYPDSMKIVQDYNVGYLKAIK